MQKLKQFLPLLLVLMLAFANGASARSHTGIAGNTAEQQDRTVQNSPKAYKNWGKALANVLAQSGPTVQSGGVSFTGNAHVALVSDSTYAGYEVNYVNGIGSQIMNCLGQSLPVAEGIVLTSAHLLDHGVTPPHWAISGTWSQSSAANGPWGQASGQGCEFTSNGTSGTCTYTSPNVFDTFVLYYDVHLPGGQDFMPVSVDGKQVGTVPIEGTIGYHKAQFTCPLGKHVITIGPSPTTKQVSVIAMWCLNSQAHQIYVSNLSVVGGTQLSWLNGYRGGSTSWNSDPLDFYFNALFGNGNAGGGTSGNFGLPINLVVHQLLINDAYGFGSSTFSQWQSNLQTFIEKYHNNNIDVLLVVPEGPPPDESGTFTHDFQPYNNTYRQYAVQYNTGLSDGDSRWGGYQRAYNLGYYYAAHDCHPSVLGAQDIARANVSCILPAALNKLVGQSRPIRGLHR